MTNPYNKDYPISWEELHRNARALAWRLLDHGPWKGIIAITRGGLVPAAIVALKQVSRLANRASLNYLKALMVTEKDICLLMTL